MAGNLVANTDTVTHQVKQGNDLWEKKETVTLAGKERGTDRLQKLYKHLHIYSQFIIL